MSNKQFPQRKSPRLKEYDYSQSGAYFVTIGTYHRQILFGRIDGDEMLLNKLGRLAQEELKAIPHRWQTVDIDLFVVMPNHVHLIVVLENEEVNPHHLSDAKNRVPTLGRVIGNYKAGVTRHARENLLVEGTVWQSRYHDHIIRTEKSLQNIREYVLYNPQLWEKDTFYSV